MGVQLLEAYSDAKLDELGDFAPIGVVQDLVPKIDYHLVRHHLSAGILHLLPVSSSNQTADIFTKTFPLGRFRDLVSKLKMASVRPP